MLILAITPCFVYNAGAETKLTGEQMNFWTFLDRYGTSWVVGSIGGMALAYHAALAIAPAYAEAAGIAGVFAGGVGLGWLGIKRNNRR